ncbi:hypothetical protein ABFP37_05410 [Burkholderia sp. RS01]|uniref:hypothetical protein n=1 Tax=unclassified Burkholderia TaxID=2613784 RepID=UPI003218AEAD
MLATYRLPLLDARSFAADERVAKSVMLPRMWRDGDFVRGMGRVTKRPSKAIERWPHENAFADLNRTLTFPPFEVQALNRQTEHCHVYAIRKRAWLALPGTTALLDVDLGLRIDLVGSGGQAYPRSGQFDLEELFDLIASGATLPVHLRSDEPGRTHPLFKLGKPLARHYALSTSNERGGDPLVDSGLMAVVVEAPGLTALLPKSFRAKRIRGSQIQLASRDVTLPDGKKLRVHVLSSEWGAKAVRKRIRELRIHLLRLHSASELMGCIASLTQHSLPIAEKKGEYGFDALQFALRECVKSLQDDKAIGDASPESVLRAVSSRTFGDDLQLKYERMLGAMRPKVGREINRFLESVLVDKQPTVGMERANQIHQQAPTTNHHHYYEGVNTMNFQFHGQVTAGAIGPDAKVEIGVFGNDTKVEGDIVTADTLTIGNKEFDRETLLKELIQLRDHFRASNDEGATEAADQLALAASEAERKNSSGMIRLLKSTGTWIADAAGSIGAGVAQAAIQAAIGLS